MLGAIHGLVSRLKPASNKSKAEKGSAGDEVTRRPPAVREVSSTASRERSNLLGDKARASRSPQLTRHLWLLFVSFAIFVFFVSVSAAHGPKRHHGHGKRQAGSEPQVSQAATSVEQGPGDGTAVADETGPAPPDEAELLAAVDTSEGPMDAKEDDGNGERDVVNIPPSGADAEPKEPRQIYDTGGDGSYETEKQVLEFAKNKNLAMVMRMLPKLNRYDYDDGTSEGTLLHYAAFHGWTNLMDILIKEKDVSATLQNQYDKRTPLLSACRGGRLDSVKYCIKSLKKADWSAGNENGLTCSHFAAREGHPEILSYMIELNKLADIPLSAQSHKADKKLQWTPLHYAANNGHTECAIILLLEAGANPYKRGFRMQSAIDLARARGDKVLVDIMHDPLKFKITNLLDASLGSERKAREKAITALREDILKLKEALHSAGPEGEHAGMPGGAPAMVPAQQQQSQARVRRFAGNPEPPQVGSAARMQILGNHQPFRGFASMGMAARSNERAALKRAPSKRDVAAAMSAATASSTPANGGPGGDATAATTVGSSAAAAASETATNRTIASGGAESNSTQSSSPAAGPSPAAATGAGSGAAGAAGSSGQGSISTVANGVHGAQSTSSAQPGNEHDGKPSAAVEAVSTTTPNSTSAGSS